MPELTPEARLLCLCAGEPLPEDRKAQILDIAQKGLNWPLFKDLAFRHRVSALAHKNLSLAAPGAVPPDAAASLRELYFQNLTWNLAAQKDLILLLRTLAESGIAAVPYKGLILAETAYGDIALRRFNDLDVLIRAGDLEPAAFALRSLGYSSDLPEDPARLERHVRVLRDFAFRRPGHSCPVEVQWRLTQRYHPLSGETEVAWTRLRPETLAGFPVKALSWPDTLLVLCHHGLYHSWEHLQMVADVAQASRAASAANLDWPALLDEAGRRGALRTLLLGLLLARNLLGLEPASAVAEAAGRDPFIESLSGRISAGFFDESSFIRKARAYFFLEARMIGGLRNRARYLWGRLTTPNEEDRQALALPKLVYPFHPVLRLSRLFRKYFLKSH